MTRSIETFDVSALPDNNKTIVSNKKLISPIKWGFSQQFKKKDFLYNNVAHIIKKYFVINCLATWELSYAVNNKLQ